MNDKYVLILQKSISSLFLLFGIIAVIFNLLVSAGEDQGLVDLFYYLHQNPFTIIKECES